ncbi:ADP-forming succinate--CoA ligase subunit beta [Corynebacterium mayonis]|uniref:ADP-forming succinate--CoA ligase subunit beta n=1 Tax=Corynebacterium mayonis TaxID=3062461 RepID=UPI0031407726
MDLYEYQGRALLANHKVPVLQARVATTAEQARAAWDELDADLVVIKAQVKTGGRGKAGGVKLARSEQETVEAAEAILGMDIKGHTVHRVMIAQGADIAEEYYFSILLDRPKRKYLAMLSREGGMDIETLAKERPEALVRKNFSPLDGFTDDFGREIAREAGFSEDEADKLVPVMQQLYTVYDSEDALLVEINPLVKTVAGEIIALDAKVSLDANAAFRHPEHAKFADNSATDPLEVRAQALDLNYVKLDGNVGIIGNGAGLVMSTVDVVGYVGEALPTAPAPANFLDIGGGADATVMANGLGLILSDQQVDAIFVNVFGGITACDEVAHGIVRAMDILRGEGKEPKPIVVRLDGNNADEGRRILDEAGLDFVERVDTMDGAAKRVAELADQAAAERNK